MKRRTKFFALSGVLGLASLAGVCSVHAQLKFQTTQPVEFTFNPTLSLNVSGDLVVNNLTAGSNADSNEITVAVNTNVMNGYYLAATAGTSSTNTNLVNTSNSDYIFTSLATNADLDNMSNADGNTWGYAFKVGSGSYGNYSGLPLDNDDSGETGAILVNTTTAADSKLVTFKIGAKSAADQSAGVYTNTINFFAVTAPLPESKTINDLEYMQDFATLTTEEKSAVLASMTQNQQYQLKDSRDEKTYYISKLVDGNVWMTQNLDHDIDNNAIYTPNNTDIRNDWQPNVYIYGVGDEDWIDDNNESGLYNPGDLCWNGIISHYYSGMVEDTTIPCSQYDNDHYRIGNYYSWTAAVAMNDSSDYVGHLEDVNQSICPAGWRLPVYEGDKSYGNLATGLNFASGTDGNIQNAPVYLVYGDIWEGNYMDNLVGAYGSYWMSIVSNDMHAYSFNFDYEGWLNAVSDNFRSSGSPVRCVAR